MAERSREPASPGDERYTRMLESALRTFAARGYRRTSMDDVARDAHVSRPGLYLRFPSKQALLRAAVEHALERDVSRAEVALAARSGSLRGRLAEALDLWVGQYTGPLAIDLEGLLEQDALLLDRLPAAYRARFRDALTSAIEAASAAEHGAGRFAGLGAEQVADVLLALAAGTKRQAATQADFRLRLRHGLELLLP